MFSLNRAQIVGNATRDPELRMTPNGQAVCSFGVATNRRWRDKDGNNQEATEFHNIVAWGKLAELMEQLVHKGSKIYIEGRMQTRSWEGQDGGKRNRTEIVMEDFILLTPKSAAGEFSPSVSKDVEVGDDVKEFPIKNTKENEAKPAKKSEEKKENKKEEVSDDEINLDDIPF